MGSIEEGVSAAAARPMATMVVISQCSGTANSLPSPPLLTARNWRGGPRGSR